MTLAPAHGVCAAVVTHNRPKELRLVVQGLLEQSYPLASIIVFDNASQAPSAAEVLEGYPITIIRSEKNLGGAGGFSEVLSAALNMPVDWIWLMDDDAVPTSNALENLIRAIPLTCKNALPVGSLCSAVYEFGKLAPMHRRTYSKVLGIERKVSLSHYTKNLVPIDCGSFVGFMVNRYAVMKVGLPRADFFLAYDDTEYSLRLLKFGYSNWLVPSSEIIHLRSPSSRLRGTEFGLKHFLNVRNRIIVCQQYANAKILSMLIASCIGIMVWIFSKNRFKRIASLKRALLSGIRQSTNSIP